MVTSKEQVRQLRIATNTSVMDCVKTLEMHGGDYAKALEHLRTINLKKATKQADRETHDGLIVVKRSGYTVCAVELNCETDFVALTQEYKTLTHHIADQILGDATLTEGERVLAADFIDSPGQSIALAIQELAGKLGENITLGRAARYESSPNTLVEGYIHAGAIDGYGPLEGRLGVLIELETEASVIESAILPELARNLALQIASDNPLYIARDLIPAAELNRQRNLWTDELEASGKSDAIKAKILEGKLNKFYQQTCLSDQTYIRDENIRVGDLLRQTGEQLGAPVKVARFIRYALADQQL